MEDHDVVDAVDELGPEALLHDLHHRALHLRVVLLARVLLDDLRAEVGRHDDHGVAEVDRAPLAVGETPVVEHLQQHVEHVRMRLLNLIQQDDRIGPPAHRFGEVAALLVADVAGRRADQARHGVLLHELRHVDADHGVLGVEEELGERLAQLRLADARRPEEQERAVRAARVGEPGARAPDGVRHDMQRLVLADDALGQRFLHAQQLLLLPFQHLRHRDAGPLGDHFGDLLLGHLVAYQGRRLVLGGAGGAQALLELGDLAVLQLRHAPEIAGAARGLELEARPIELLADLRRALQRRLLGLPHLLEVGVLLLQGGERGFECRQALA